MYTTFEIKASTDFSKSVESPIVGNGALERVSGMHKCFPGV